MAQQKDNDGCGNITVPTNENQPTNPYNNMLVSQRSSGTVDDLTNRLDRMQVDYSMDCHDTQSPNCQLSSDSTTIGGNNTAFILSQQQTNLKQDTSFDEDNSPSYYNNQRLPTLASLGFEQQQHQMAFDTTTTAIDDMPMDADGYETATKTTLQETNFNNILIVTNVDMEIFNDKSTLRRNFESLFLVYDRNITFRYLESFRRVRLDFTSDQSAQSALSNLRQYKLGRTVFKCYTAQMIKLKSQSSKDSLDDNNSNSNYLSIPKPTKQFLISPPASPPVGWEPVTESSPCIDVQLMSAIANLVPGKVHEIHPGSESQPGIFVEVCEEPQFINKNPTIRRVPRTMSPEYYHRQPMR